MKKIFLITLVTLFTFTGFTQQRELEWKDYLNPEFYSSYISGLNWIPDSESYTFVENDTLWKVGVKRLKKQAVITTKELNQILVPMGMDSLKRLPRINWRNLNEITFIYQQKIWNYNLKNQKVNILNSFDKQAENTEIHPKTYTAAYTKGQNVFVSVNQKEKQVTFDTIPGIVNGTSVHRSEFGITNGLFFSPKGNALAFYHKDETMVTDYPLVDTEERVAELDNIKYPMAGMTSHQVKIGIYHIDSGKVIYLDTQGKKDDYLTNISWGPEEKYIYVAELNRAQNHMHLNQFNASDGKFIKTLFEEKNDRYVEPEHLLHFLPNNPNQFIWFSERDGFQHLYLYDTDGNLIDQLTQGDWIVNSINKIADDGSKLWFYGTKNSPLNRDLFVLNLKNKTIKDATAIEGTHTVKISDNGKYLLDTYSNMDMGREYRLLNRKGKVLKTLLTDKNPRAEFKMGETTVSTLTAKDGTTLYYRMIKPFDFDPQKKYPVFVYVYGGPHAQLVNNVFGGGAGLFLNKMANKGYIVFTLDNRGSANRGFEFESTIHRRLGEMEMSDQLVGIDYLKTLDYVDSNRIGINGWSYGGFMTMSLKLDYPEIFKVACAGGPVIDWKYYEVMYGERYMDTPQENPEGYKNNSLINKADQLEGRLLIIHGTEDPTVVWQHTQQFVKTCVDHNVLVDYFIYPGHGHNVRGKDRIHLFRKIAQYFDDFL